MEAHPGHGQTKHNLSPGGVWEPKAKALVLASGELAREGDGPVSD